MNLAIIEDITTEFDLLGITSADIIMTRGDSKPIATKFEFN